MTSEKMSSVNTFNKSDSNISNTCGAWHFCQTCLEKNSNNLKDMMQSHLRKDTTEVYAEMLNYCFSLQMGANQREKSEHIYLICDLCIKKLRDVVRFKRQVEDAQKNIKLKFLACQQKLTTLEQCKSTAENSDSDVDYSGIEGQELLSFLDDEDLSSESDSIPIRLPIARKILKLNNIKPKKAKRSLKKMTKSVKNTLKMVEKLSVNNNSSTYKPTEIESNLILEEKQISDEDVNKYEDSIEEMETIPVLRISSRYHHLPYTLEKNQMECKICYKTFESHRHLQIHMPEHFPNFYCTHCGRGFANRAQLTRHESIHSKEKFECSQCPGKLFKTKLSQQEHMKRKHSDSPANHRCPHCNDCFISYYDRQKHLANVHGETKQRRELKCKLCSKTFSTPSHRSIHFRRVHLNERKHECQTCGKVFFANQCLRRHMVMHTSDKQFACSFCEKSFQRKYTLTVHLKTHKNEKI